VTVEVVVVAAGAMVEAVAVEALASETPSLVGEERI
jgi:hypothetical protein